MKTSENGYHFNLFKPKTEHSRRNRNLVLTMVLIWFISVFGFQLLLIILQKPTPEKAYISFESVWDNVKGGTATETEKQKFIKSVISVYGKSTVKKEKRDVLIKGISGVAYSMLSDSARTVLSGQVSALQELREKLSGASDEVYTQIQVSLSEKKKAINEILCPVIGINPESIEASLLPYCLDAEGLELAPEDQAAFPEIMKLYLIHNQSVLTDTKFLGFPFHYFYTAELLLILFVLLCLIYSIRITQLDKKYLSAVN